jgi:hypothetical protein
LAAASQVSAASLIVVRVGARIVPALKADFVATRQARASASERKVFRSVLRSAGE